MLSLLGGCTTIYEDKYDWSRGWRVGVVVRVVPFEQLKRYEIPRCPENELAPDKIGATWAVARFRMGRMTRWAAAPMSDPAQFKVGAPVYVNERGCERDMQPRIAMGGQRP